MPDGTQLPRPADAGAINLPNAITFARLCAVPVAVWLVLHQDFMAAFWLFIAAGASDAIDGWLARRRGPSYVGALLDPVADKALLVTMYVALAVVHVLPDWLAILVVFRDVVIVGGVLVLYLLGQPPVMRPLLISKVNTALQLFVVAVALLLAGLGQAAPRVMTVLVWAVVVSTVASGAAYVRKAARTG
ncbi:CDP-alcohol phosphatidyltransferase family protein [Limobrevibacterium gyesilva]|uniref:CDP-diacylglycerol--glycerol-3-phosphate 3-phosphatidyltransferase n=1 Tax=Limobrevibacterium gyesilva TaxID=2991712 RepID=A0AA41YME7_9PROT|nr:CDP-alcohol phosphatidyltransferase family protein [Limobrevibacterium gyesilva]MCW3473168.1 CDP-alcohol phosphatidyltransferase family protein [Limobrevibacterium gyesilva]